MAKKHKEPEIVFEFEDGSRMLEYSRVSDSALVVVSEFTGAVVSSDDPLARPRGRSRPRFVGFDLALSDRFIGVQLTPDEPTSLRVGELRALAEAVRRIFSVPKAEVSILPACSGEKPDVFDA